MSGPLPSHSAFPAGLRVALLDSDGNDRMEAEHQLRQHHYDVCSCPSVQELIGVLGSPASGFTPDVVVADLDLCTSHLKRCLKGVPLVVTSRRSDAASVLRGIEFGASEVLQKPLCSLKLKNIWQHTVRKMMGRTAAGKQASQDSKQSGGAGAPCFPSSISQTSSDPASCSADSCLLDTGSLASSAVYLKLEQELDQELEQDVQSAMQRCSSSGTQSAAHTAGNAASSPTSGRVLASPAAAGPPVEQQRGRGQPAMGIPHSGPFLPLRQGLAWGFPRDLSKITTPLQMPVPPPLPFPMPCAGMPLPPGAGMPVPPFMLPPLPLLPGMLLPSPAALAAATAAAAAASSAATIGGPAAVAVPAASKPRLPPMIPTPAPCSSAPLLPTNSLQCPSVLRTPARSSPPPAGSSHSPAPKLEQLLPALPRVSGAALSDEDVDEEHPLARACADEEPWSPDLPLSSSPLGGASLLSGASCGASDARVLGLRLDTSSSFADLINETLSYAR